MCRWLAYWGQPMLIEDILYKPKNSLIDQSLHSHLGAQTTNGDGFGIGWYGTNGDRTPAVFHSIEPAWNDRNLHELARHIAAPIVFAHVRAATSTPVQQTNCHPFRHGRWLFMHNGVIRDFAKVKRDLAVMVAPELFPQIEGSTDSELLFYLALTLGLEDDPPHAIECAVGLVEAVGRRHGVEHPIQMTIATTNGESLWVFRYSSERKSRSLFFSTKIQELRKLYPDHPVVKAAGDDTRLVVSEPIGSLPGLWQEMPESAYGLVHRGPDELHPFVPRPPA